MLEKFLVITGAVGMWLSLTCEAMALAAVNSTGIIIYGVLLVVFVATLRFGLWLGE